MTIAIDTEKKLACRICATDTNYIFKLTNASPLIPLCRKCSSEITKQFIDYVKGSEMNA